MTSRPAACLACLATAAFFLAGEGVAHATPQCLAGTHPSQWGFHVAGTLSVLATLAILGLGVKVALGAKGRQRIAAAVVTLLCTATVAFFGFWFTLIAGVILSGCVHD